MKVWECTENEVRDSGTYRRKQLLVGPVTNSTIAEIIDREWPEPVLHTWNQDSRRGCLIQSSQAKEWQCGAMGPDGLWCHRVRNHAGNCSDLLVSQDRRELRRQLIEATQEEMGLIFHDTHAEALQKRTTGRHSGRYSTRKLRDMLKEDLV